MRRLFATTLSTRIMGALILGLALTTLVVSWRSEAVVEAAMLDQTKRQALVFLSGLAREIQLKGSPLDPRVVQPVLEAALRHDRADGPLGFSILRLYAYDRDGKVFANAGAGDTARRDIGGYYGTVLRRGEPYLGEEVEHATDPASGRLVPTADVITPLRRGNGVVAGLEVELNLDATTAMIRGLDNHYEAELLAIVAGSSLLMLGFMAWLVHRGLLRPITSLGHLTHRIARGEFSARAALRSSDEIGRLGHAIDQMAESLERLFNEQEQAYMQTLQSLAKALEAKDSYTARHSARVAKYSVMLGRRLGLPEGQLKLLKQGALMHDLGKIGVADTILNKPGSLTEEEFAVMRNHPVVTAAIMRPLKRFKEFAEIAAWHHERWDGRGYPDGLAGEAIPLLARIVAIADTWDAMTGDRIYRKGMSVETALATLEQEREMGQWDPRLLEEFITMVRAEQAAQREIEQALFDGEPTPASGGA